MAIKEGDLFPAITAKTHTGETIDLGEYRGQRHVVLYFYPRDLTPGCSREAIDFDRKVTEFAALDTVVLGMSVDSLDSHQNFAKALGLSFSLLSDEDQSISRRLGILHENPKGPYAQRVTFLIDKSGVVRRIFHVDAVDGHVDDVLAAVQQLAP